uniref:SAYSvFN domain-containing protein n=1 Tax=Caenorhabditis tropicalis TaxID=1561998 RepID=A0A1I7U6Q3_9PELO
MSNVLRNLQEFRKEKEKAKLKEDQVERVNGKIEEKVVGDKPSEGKEWDFLTKSESVPEDYEEQSVISNRIAIVVYVIGQALAAWVQFGAVFFILSLILFTYWNTGRRRHGEMSAYSVFNQNCERLAGSMTAEHFERDMLRQRR